MIILNNVPFEQKKKVEYLPKRPIYPYIVPSCPKCHNDMGVAICTPSDPKQYYCLNCMYDFFYVGCLNCQFADHPPFSFKCVRCTRNPMPEDILDEAYYGSADGWSVFAPRIDRWEPYEKIDLSWVDK